ncbi:MAG: hypothetical protein A3H94_04760 [Acidobacteria bacterium RIFCSPLOWO2_02_FULL_60_20]|nr:MAG: hypothetical protein A3H94_04760 [Acidobacteria bacterium RIFCSPLOWO2_02_FULL_60_20]
MVDISILLVLAITTGVLGYLGIHLALHSPETARARNRYRAIFLGLTVLAVSLTLWQGMRNYFAATTTNTLLETVQRVTQQTSSAVEKITKEPIQVEVVNQPPETPPTVAVNVAPPPAPQVIIQQQAPKRQQLPQPDGEIKSRLDLKVGGDVVKPAMKNQRPYIRERLTEFISEGQQIKKECMDDSIADADALSRGETWANEVMEFLSGYMGTEYKEGFEAADGSRPSSPFVLPNSRIKEEVWKKVDERTALLNDFLMKVMD